MKKESSNGKIAAWGKNGKGKRTIKTKWFKKRIKERLKTIKTNKRNKINKRKKRKVKK